MAKLLEVDDDLTVCEADLLGFGFFTGGDLIGGVALDGLEEREGGGGDGLRRLRLAGTVLDERDDLGSGDGDRGGGEGDLTLDL